MAPVLFQSEGGGTVLQVSVALGPQTGGQGRERSASNLFSDPLDHAFDRRPTDPNPAWRRMVKALDAMVTTSLCHDGDRRLRSEN